MNNPQTKPQTRRKAAQAERAAMQDLLAPIKGRLYVSAIISGVSALSGILAFIAIVEIARRLISYGAQDGSLLVWVFIGAGAAMVRLIFMAVSMQVSHYADADFQYSVRKRLARHMALLPLGALADRNSGEIKKMLADDIDEMHHLVAHALNESVSSVVAATAAFVYLTFIDWRLACVALIGFTLSLVSLARSMKGYSHKITRYTKAGKQLNQAAVEHFDGAEVAKLFPEGGLAKRFAAMVSRHSRIERDWVQDFAKYSALSKLFALPVITMVVILGVGGWMVMAGDITGVTLLPFLIIGTGMVNPLMSFVQSSASLRKARMAAVHTAAFLKEPRLPEPKHPKKPHSYDITFKKVHFGYGDAAVLKDVTFTIPQGTVTALVGPSGSGKTTLTRLVPRFYEAVSGSVRIGGIDVRDIPTQELLGHMGLLFQQPILLQSSVCDNIRLGRPDATDKQVKDAAKKAAIHDVIMGLPDGYNTVLTNEGGVLSGGEQQRVTLARIFLQQAPILILDEPTAALDAENEALIQQALTKLVKNKTVMVVAHRLRTIKNADQIILLDKGSIVERGTHKELMQKNGRYAQLWRLQEKGAAV